MMIKRLWRRFSDVSIRIKLLVCFCLLIVLPVSLVAGYNYKVSFDIIDDKTNRYSHDILHQTIQTMNNRLEKIEDISFNIFVNTDVQSMLLAAKERPLDEYEASRYTTQIESILAAQVLYHDEINAIFIVSSSGHTYSLDKTRQNYGLLEEYIDKISQAAGGVVWFGGIEDQRVVALARTINSVQTQQPVGYMVIYVSVNYFYDVLADTKSVMGGEIYTIDSNGQIVVSDNRESIGTISEHYDPENTSGEYSFATQSIDGIEQYVATSEVMENGWRTVLAVPVSDYLKEIHYLRDMVVILTLIVLVAAVLIALRMANDISRPIFRLTETMTRFGDGDLSARCHVQTQDEIGQCTKAFCDMADHINDLISRVYEEQLMKRDAELKSLQMQINPHFLYNTLETINWMARTRGNDDVGVMVKSLGDLMRATINGNDFVTLADERINLNNYLAIQSYRYADKFSAEIVIPESIESLVVPKLIIQPLVENAIYHGIAPSFGKGKIMISVQTSGADLLISVIDDGVGMTEEVINRVLDISSTDEKDSSYSIGIQNVIRRIKTLFGEQYGIGIKSEIGDGTEIIMRLPQMNEFGKST